MRRFLIAFGAAIITSAFWLTVMAVREEAREDRGGRRSRSGPDAPRGAEPAEVERLRSQVATLEDVLSTERREGAARPETNGREGGVPTPATPGLPTDGATGDPAAPGTGLDGESEIMAEIRNLDRILPGGLDGNDEFWGRLARLYLMAGDQEGALRCFVQAFRLDPEDWDWREGIASIDAEIRLPALEALAEEFPQDDEVLGDLADAYAELNLMEQAAATYIKALDIDPSDDEWTEKLAHADPWRAATLLERLSSESPQDDELLGDLADAYRESGRSREALATYERAFAIDPADTEWSERIVAIDPVRGIELIEHALQAEPAQDELWGDLGDAYGAVGRREDAVNAYRQAIGLDPEDDEWVRKLAEADVNLAISYQEDRVRRYPNDDEAWGNLADTYAAAGRTEDALRTYRHALEIDPDDGEWPDKIAALEEQMR